MKMLAAKAKVEAEMQIPPVINKFSRPIPFPSLRLWPARCIIFVVAVICFINSWDGQFVFDDSEAIVGNKDVLPSRPLSDVLIHDFWGRKLTNTSHKSYRPLTILTYRWNVWLSGGLETPGFHIPNIVLHGLVSVLLLDMFFYLLHGVQDKDGEKEENGRRKRWDEKAEVQEVDTLSFLCALLFAVHPVHTESVAGIVGRADLLCALFFILSFLAYIRGCTCDKYARPVSFSLAWLLASFVFCGLATFSKEQGITVIGICSAFDILSVCRLDIGTWLGLKKPDTAPSSPRPSSPTTSPSSPPPLSSPTTATLGSNGISLDKNGNGLIHIKPVNHTHVGISAWKLALLKRQAFLTAAAISILVVRWRIMGSSPPIFHLNDNPHSFVNGTLLRMVNYHYIYAINAWVLLAPVWLCFDWSMGCVPTVDSFSDPRLLAVWLFVSVFGFLAWLCLRRLDVDSARPVILAVALMVVPFLPATNLLFRVGFVVAERVLYLPSMGFCFLVGLGLRSLCQRPGIAKMMVYSFMVLVLVWMVRSVQRSSEWRDEQSLFQSGEKVCPLNAKIHYNIGKVSADLGDEDTAVERYRHAIELNPLYDQSMNNLANIYKDRGNLAEAEQLLDKAVSINDKFPSAWMNRGIVKASLKKFDESEKCYLKAIQQRRNYPDCYYNLGNMYLDMNEHQKALTAFKNATILKPTHFNAWNNAIILLENLEKYEQALNVGNVALKHLPNYPQIMRTMGNVYGKQGNYPMCEKMFLAAEKLQPNDPTLLINIGVLYHRWKKYQKAMQYYEMSKRLNPHDPNTDENIRMLKEVMAVKG